jgi:hypothetical protein
MSHAPRQDASPWTVERHKAMRADPEAYPMIWLLVTQREARWLADGIVSEALSGQAERALKERT